jgi:hypothetical protein
MYSIIMYYEMTHIRSVVMIQMKFYCGDNGKLYRDNTVS